MGSQRLDLRLLFEEEPDDPLAPAVVADELERELDLDAGTLDVSVLHGRASSTR